MKTVVQVDVYEPILYESPTFGGEKEETFFNGTFYFEGLHKKLRRALTAATQKVSRK